MNKYLLPPVLLVLSGDVLALSIPGFNDLQTKSEAFTRSTCVGFIVNQDAISNDQKDLFNVCGTMVNSVNAVVGNGGGTALDRQLNVDSLAAGFQNIVPEETLAPIGISSDTSSINLAAINTRLAKIRFGGGAGDELFSSSRLGFFLNGTGGFGETDQTKVQNASDFYSAGLISGIDYKISENFIIGLAGSYSSFNLDFDKNTDVAGGQIDSDNYSVTVYSNYSIANAYIEGVFTYGWSDYDIEREVFIDSNSATVAQTSATAFADPDGEQFSVSLAAGYDFYSGSLSYGPYARIAYFETAIDSYNESGARGLNLNVSQHEAESLETVLGAQATYALSYAFGVLVPHVRAEWHHEYKNSQRSFDISYVNDPRNNVNVYRSTTGNPDRNFFNISAGFSTNLKYGIQAFFDYETILGLSDIDAHKFSLGMRMEF